MTEDIELRISPRSLGNYYGGLSLLLKDSKFFLGIENYSDTNWTCVPSYVAKALLQWEITNKGLPEMTADKMSARQATIQAMQEALNTKQVRNNQEQLELDLGG